MPHIESFPPGWAAGGFVPLALGIWCAGMLTRDKRTTRFKCARTVSQGRDGLPGMDGVKVVTGAAAAVLLMACVGVTPASADTIEAALVRAYQNNPQLNSQRASVRSTDENV